MATSLNLILWHERPSRDNMFCLWHPRYQQRLQQNLVFLASVADKQPQAPSQQPVVQPMASAPPPAAGLPQGTASQVPQPVPVAIAATIAQGP